MFCINIVMECLYVHNEIKKNICCDILNGQTNFEDNILF